MRRSRRSKRIEQGQGLNLTPLLDVVLQLITFFMMLVHFGTRIEGSTVAVRLPVAASAMPKADMGVDRLVVIVDASGSLVFQGKAMQDAAADLWWDEQAKLRRTGQELLGSTPGELTTRVFMRADKRAPYGMVRRQLAMAQRRGFARFTLVVLRSQR